MPSLGKNIAILGLGIEGLSLIKWLNQHAPDAKFTVFDQKPKSELKLELKQLSSLPHISYQLGKNCLKSGLKDFDTIYRSPGFYRFLPAIIAAEKEGVTISSATKLFFDLCPCPIIGVTGTKGKGTTTTLIYEILKASNKSVYLGGNIGKPAIQFLDQLKSTDHVCLELSSFQLQDMTKSPHIAVVLNTTSEHLDVHQHTKEYRQAKQNIVFHQTQSNFAVINNDYPVSRQFSRQTKAKVFWFSRKKQVKPGSYVKNNTIYQHLKDKAVVIGLVGKLQLRGQHNWENVTAAITAASLAGADLNSLKQAVFTFKGLEHRLELVGEVRKVKYYDDSFSTTPETAIAAIKAFTEPTIIILGGSDKGSDYTKLGQVISSSSHLKAIILIGQMAKNIKATIDKAGGFSGQLISGQPTMTQIVNKASQLAQPGEAVVLSPACASFDMFKNYKDRGQHFKAAVNSLK